MAATLSYIKKPFPPCEMGTYIICELFLSFWAKQVKHSYSYFGNVKRSKVNKYLFEKRVLSEVWAYPLQSWCMPIILLELNH